MSAVTNQEPSCPRCRQPLEQKGALGLKPRELEPGEFYPCARCGCMLVLNSERALRFATGEEIADEIRVRPSFRIRVAAAERRRREFLAARSGFTTPASLPRALAQ